jgi:hypothetical protein
VTLQVSSHGLTLTLTPRFPIVEASRDQWDVVHRALAIARSLGVAFEQHHVAIGFTPRPTATLRPDAPLRGVTLGGQRPVQVWIATHLSGAELLEVVLHELAHAADALAGINRGIAADEAAADAFATRAMRALGELGRT